MADSMFLNTRNLFAAHCVFRAARWLSMLPLIPILCPAALGAPRIEAEWSANPVRPGKPFTLTITARWDGEAGRYTIGMPEAQLPEQIAKQSVTSRSFREGEDNVVACRLQLVAERGSFAPVSIKLPVFESGAKEPSEVTFETEPLLADVARWRGIPLQFLIPAGVIAIILLGALRWLLVRRRPPVPVSAELAGANAVQVLEKLKAELHTCRVRGDTTGFLDAAAQILSLSSRPDTAEAREIGALLEQSRYGDLRLSSEEMERWHRQIKRIELVGPDPV